MLTFVGPGGLPALLDELVEHVRRINETVLAGEHTSLRELGPLLAGRYKRRDYTTPTLLLFGDRDVAQDPRNLRGIDERVPSFSYELIEGCSHFIVDERPELVVERALGFFA